MAKTSDRNVQSPDMKEAFEQTDRCLRRLVKQLQEGDAKRPDPALVDKEIKRSRRQIRINRGILDRKSAASG